MSIPNGGSEAMIVDNEAATTTFDNNSSDASAKFCRKKIAKSPPAFSTLCIGSPPLAHRVLAVPDAGAATCASGGATTAASSCSTIFGQNQLQLTVPGALISPAAGLMRGHGTFLQDNALHSSLAGAIIQTNKLIRVKPIKSRYHGDIGDVVVGRIVEVQQKRWKVDIFSRQHGVLLLNSVNLPGGELRRKSIEDELLMREYLREGDLVSAEVQQLYHDGSLSLHTRSLKYGKLGQGVLVKVLPHLVRHRKSHFHNLPFGSSVILGRNGYIWVSRHLSEDEASSGGYLADTQLVPPETREVIARTANCIKLLARNSVSLFDTTIICAFNASQAFTVPQLADADIADRVAQDALAQCAIAADMGQDDDEQSSMLLLATTPTITTTA